MHNLPQYKPSWSIHLLIDALNPSKIRIQQQMHAYITLIQGLIPKNPTPKPP